MLRHCLPYCLCRRWNFLYCSQISPMSLGRYHGIAWVIMRPGNNRENSKPLALLLRYTSLGFSPLLQSVMGQFVGLKKLIWYYVMKRAKYIYVIIARTDGRGIKYTLSHEFRLLWDSMRPKAEQNSCTIPNEWDNVYFIPWPSVCAFIPHFWPENNSKLK